MFQKYFKPKLEAELRLQEFSARGAEVFMDINGLPANGDLTIEIQEAIERTAFLIIFIGRSYPNSVWCGKELMFFINQFQGSRQEALKRTFVIVLDKAAEQKNWGDYLENPERPIFIRFYDEETGQNIPPVLEDKDGQAVPGPRFLRGIRKVVETMAERSVSLKLQSLES